jgi:uncharacterized repeat protein (TIGR01451 family)
MTTNNKNKIFKDRYVFRKELNVKRKKPNIIIQAWRKRTSLFLILILLLAQSSNLMAGVNIALKRPIDLSFVNMVKAAKLDGYQLRYKDTTRGAIVFTGNALGLNTFNNISPNPINGSIDAYTTIDQTQQVTGYPSGTTKDWTKNSSMAVLDIPTDGEILYAELVWGANYKNQRNNINIESQINTPVKLTTPTSEVTVTPDPTTASETDYGYVRTANVTDIIKQTKGGQYTTSGVPGIIDPLDKSGNYAGWTLAVVFAQADLPIRNLTFYTSSESVFTNKQNGNTVRVTGFGTPVQGEFNSKIFISTQEGDSDLTGDQLLFGQNADSLQPLSGPNNLENNFFGSQINNMSGTLDTRGTFGNRNHTLGVSEGGRRHGFDITAIDVSNKMRNGQTEAFIKGTSTGDIYVVNALGVQIDVNAPNPVIEIVRDKEFVRVGESIKYDITITNDGIIDGKKAKLSSFIPEGTIIVPGSFTSGGQPVTEGNPANGYDIPDVKPGETQTFSFVVRVNSIPPSGVFENEATVDYSYIPVAGGDEVFEEAFSSKVITFPLTPIGLPPVAVDDAATTLPNTPVEIDIVANDSDPDGDLNIQSTIVTTPPNNGRVAIDPLTGKATYTPNANYVGTDTFVYNICDNGGQCDDAKVTITIKNPTPPTANDDQTTTKQGTPVDINVITNDTDPLNPTITSSQLKITTPPSNGTVIPKPNSTDYTYTPNNPDFVGEDTFEYELCNLDGCDKAIVKITISPKILPNAVDDSGTTKENKPVVIPLLTNDSPGEDAEFDNSTLKIVVGKSPLNGTVTIDQNAGTSTYTPNPNFTGNDTFSYEICNDEGNCDEAVVTVNVTPLSPPTAVDDTSTTDQNTPVIISVPSNDTKGDAELDTSSVRVIDAPSNGTTSVNPTTGQITYTPNNNFTGEDAFIYEICDENDKCSSANVVVDVNPILPPLANPDTANTLVNEPVDIPILTNDTDPLDGITPSDFERITTQPNNGTVTFNPNTGLVRYTPRADFVGSDVFGYEICNEDGCDQTVVSVNVSAPEKPDAIDDIESTDSGIPIDIAVLPNDKPGDGRVFDNTTLKIINAPSNGSAIVSPSTNQIRYAPNPSFDGTDTFSYEICNDAGECDIANVIVVVRPPIRPDAIEDKATTPINTPVLIPILTNDDLSGGVDPKNITFPLDPRNGTITYDPTKGVTYTPNPNFTGNDRFVYKICATNNLCDSAEVTVTVLPTPPQSSNPNNPNGLGGVNNPNNPNAPRRAGQVLGVSESVGELPRTGGVEEMIANILIIIGFMMALGFFNSLYFAKYNKNR